MERSIQALKDNRNKVCLRIAEPTSTYLDKKFSSALKDNGCLKQLSWVFEMNKMNHMSKEMGGGKKKAEDSDHGVDGGFSDHSANSGDELLSPSDISGELTK